MSGAEFIIVAGVISSIVAIVDGINEVVSAALDAEGLPKIFHRASHKLPIICGILEAIKSTLEKNAASEIEAFIKNTIEDCQENWQKLKELFDKVVPEGKALCTERYYKVVKTLGKGGKVEILMKEMLESVQLLATFKILTATRTEEVIKIDLDKEKLAKTIADVAGWESSVPDSIFEEGTYTMTASGSGHTVAQGENVKQYLLKDNARQTVVKHYTSSKSLTVDDIDRACLRFLRCPDTLLVKNQLKEDNDKLLYRCIDWIFQDPQYISWNDGNSISLLWIRGGAGKGKTFMSIGIIERLLIIQDTPSVVTYFFCQNANYKLNTLEAVIKGLILQLVNQQKELGEYLRCRWDATEEHFNEDTTSWRTLWYILLEMLQRSKCSRVYVVIDALDECCDDGMADLLKLIVRTGLDYPSKIKWLLTSRPLESAERELLAGSDQVLVRLESNSKHVSEAVSSYIANKMAELHRRNTYGPSLYQKIQEELTEKAEDTYLWVSLVCKRLERVHRDQALNTIRDLPPGLHPFYNRMLNQLILGDSDIAKGCMRLLKVMLLTYRPLNVAEVGSVSGISDTWFTVDMLIDRCASFIKMRRSTDIKFVHQSAQDYLAEENGQSLLDANEIYGHGEIALSCLSHLSQRLKINIANLPRPDSTRESIKGNSLMASVNYAATFWVQHLESARKTTLIQNALGEQGELGEFLRNKFLQWLECLSLLDKLPRAIEALRILSDVVDVSKIHTIDFQGYYLTEFCLVKEKP
ncbi:hypothetical protein ABW20_dc0102432 [Dactylellina cionopaga]|nr:hypothetical protein ABW20_dc0102432 [Dactylellina cionopaga]